MKKVRFGIIGCGGMGCGHAHAITQAKAKDFCLAGVSDTRSDKAQLAGEQYGLPWFKDDFELMDSGLIDAVIIATPHYYHPPLAIYAARKGLHVLCEKPVAVAIGPARAMVKECAKAGVAFGVMFQQRNRAEMRKMKQMVDAGAVGEIFRIQMLCSNWYRTQSYYNSGAWRGTWDGEGGGILLNQAPHSLDLFQWIGGMPKRILATLDTRHHDIEVENTANALLEYEGNKHGYIYATTAEAPGVEQLMVCGDKGTLIAEGGKLKFGKLNTSLKKHLLTAKAGFAAPVTTWSEVSLPNIQGTHINVVKAFVARVLKGTPLTATGEEGTHELEISNAIYLSGFEHRAVELPVKAAEVEKLLNKLVRTRSTGKGGNMRQDANKLLTKLLGKYPA